MIFKKKNGELLKKGFCSIELVLEGNANYKRLCDHIHTFTKMENTGISVLNSVLDFRQDIKWHLLTECN